MSVDLHLQKELRAADRVFSLDITLASDSQRIVLYGPSGSGKSLTLKAIAGLMRPDSGHIRIQGRTLFDSAQGIDVRVQERNVAYLFQDYALFPHLTVAQNIAFGLARGSINLRRPAEHPAVRQWLQAFELDAIAHSRPAQISGGQRQRVALARALVAEPDMLLLDEPFSALDLSLRQRMRSELAELQSRLQVPMLLITHDPADVEALGQTVFELRDGRLHRP
ncbi:MULTISPECIES: ATP-binding cassette domain-containing protein [Herbaspirillum]|uniref:ATP-binding cassette domain-containing protein n=1 Tax=Herbaspirillum TaxID=963 RepID=UPI0003FC718D|nr:MULTISPECIES: ATP-binding cassette domain-containing protein [Herbaspirillum]MCP3655130.1 ATP-binding cassette domain-containing protein [Herbaspirillum sp.]MCP3945691.1 ATP-binding cassette domain-containing protein [Herbaspirillum sp.]MCP4032007.1 ATP-binding cassette domain-containing protein [Herbaspirillum sp.]MCP4558562.1 ATP-binding cassette domain-containing protein [Herbaspirillum sp.]MEE1635776.1 ATP-binding cassette domain-containing protein [Herbaspirillum huttiense NC40101]